MSKKDVPQAVSDARWAVTLFDGFRIARPGGEPEAKDFADVLCEWLTATLSLVSEMVVISRSSVTAYERPLVVPKDIAQALGVRYLIEGSVSRRLTDEPLLACPKNR